MLPQLFLSLPQGIRFHGRPKKSFFYHRPPLSFPPPSLHPPFLPPPSPSSDRQRGSDASWKDDHEVPEELQDFSDDEAERKQHKGKREGKRKTTPTNPTHQQPKKQAPRYSADPKMSTYFPRPQAPPPPAGGPGGGGGGGRGATAPPRFGSRGAYFTPRGFVGFMPPGYLPPPHPSMTGQLY